MNTKYMDKAARKAAKRAARRARKAILVTLTPKELKSFRKGGKGLRVFAETLGKNQPKTPAPGKPAATEAQS